MTIIGQWYGTHTTEDKVPKKHLTIKFCNLEDDLKAAISYLSSKSTANMAGTTTFTLDSFDSNDDLDDSDNDIDG
ncbi:hypothetical protein HETIRDRAFT_413851 [Heterobasidion irregulare TC 32-1]|uniref:Uncharacterized protein n=1 Tax=Heterobasidion irregulare (strain TC 32-1) TaxID=747525 RepID=W4KNZ8_HETIT|nr:uncharacterized protein HETIRDRAFT_413851 [Heterobasidion irregulare TC 32-1]ETW87537.1 hypothetical protein HETIRDRAFT_413851 [Heterobasidion irregulare TC 32-1]